MRKKRRSTYEIYARKNWLARNKALIIGITIFVVLAIGAAVVYFGWVKEPEVETIEYSAMTSASLPTLEMTYEDYQVNQLYGYTQELDIHYVRRNLYVLEDSYDIPITINLYGNTVSSVSFKIINPDNDSMVQTGNGKDLVSTGDVATTTLRVDNLIEDNTEYILDIIVHDGKDRDIHYYCRLKKDTSTSLSDQLALAIKFNSCIYDTGDTSSQEFLTDTLATKWYEDNSDYAEVSVNSSLSNVTWGNMRVTPLSDPEIEILDVDGELGYVMLNYLVTREEDNEPEYYRVSEFYRLRVTDTYAYILNYNRTTSQAFNPLTEDVVSTSSAKLGIISDEVVERKCSPSGNISCFVEDGTLWAMDSDVKTLRQIFTFSTGVTDTRGNRRQHAIKIIDVADDGSIQFVVYGYMNAGLHEGKVGIGMYTYSSETKTAEEEIFVPSNLSYEILKTSIGSLFYLSESNNLYMMLDQYLYRLNLTEDKAELIAEGLTEDNYVLHTDTKIIAWQVDGKVNDASKIKVLNMETGKTYEVSADEGCAIKVLGFLGEELVYGQGESGNIYEGLSGKEYLLMTDMYVVSSTLKVQEHDTSENGFFISAENEYNRVVLHKVIKSGDSYEDTEDYTIFSTELEAYPKLSISSDYEEIKKTVYYIEFADKTTSAGELTIDKSIKVMFTNAKTIELQDMLDSEAVRYYVYAKGEVKAIDQNAADAIDLAYAECGVVLKEDGSLFYRRGIIPSYVDISSVTARSAREKYASGEMISVTGITLAEAMYFTGDKQALIWVWDNHPYLFMGYDYLDNITMVDIETDEEIVVASSDIEDIFTTTGHVYVME